MAPVPYVTARIGKSLSDNRSPYDKWHSSLAADEASGTEALQPWHRTVASRLPDLNGRNVIEIGCGRGDFSIWLAKRFPSARFTAIDFSPAAIEIARERAHSANVDVDFRVDSAEATGLPEGVADLVVSCECLEHVADPSAMAREVRRLLAPNGMFIITTENYLNGMIIGWIKAWVTQQPFDSGSGVQPHEAFFLYWRVKRLLERAGLAVKHMQSNHFQWLLLPRVDPGALCTEEFDSPTLNRIFRPFGRHFTFEGTRAR